jgi:hypothetical protein
MGKIIRASIELDPDLYDIEQLSEDTRIVTSKSHYYKQYQSLFKSTIGDYVWLNHKTDGPACLFGKDTRFYYIEGDMYGYEEWLKRVSKLGRVLYG